MERMSISLFSSSCQKCVSEKMVSVETKLLFFCALQFVCCEPLPEFHLDFPPGIYKLILVLLWPGSSHIEHHNVWVLCFCWYINRLAWFGQLCTYSKAWNLWAFLTNECPVTGIPMHRVMAYCNVSH